MYFFMYLFFCHWVADFVCQSDWMARNKSSNNNALLIHCLVYGLVIGIMCCNFSFGFWCFLLHIPVDYISSRISSEKFKDWYSFSGPESEKPNLHDFFVVIGFDQFIHACVLIWLSTWAS